MYVRFGSQVVAQKNVLFIIAMRRYSLVKAGGLMCAALLSDIRCMI